MKTKLRSLGRARELLFKLFIILVFTSKSRSRRKAVRARMSKRREAALK